MLLYKILFELIRSLGRVFNYAVPVSYRMMKEVINDHRWDQKLGIDTSWYPLLTSRNVCSLAGASKDGTRYEALSYRRLIGLADTLKPGDQDVFVDLGCGKARVPLLMSTRKVKKAIGVEYDEGLAAMARHNLASLKMPHSSVEIIRADAANFDTSEGTIFYMYNPFGRQTMERVLINIKQGLSSHPRSIRIVYLNPLCRDLLSAQDWLVYEGECPASGAAMWRSADKTPPV